MDVFQGSKFFPVLPVEINGWIVIVGMNHGSVLNAVKKHMFATEDYYLRWERKYRNFHDTSHTFEQVIAEAVDEAE